MAYGLGIDCGTTHTAAAITHDGSVEVLRLGSRRAELPSLVFVPADGPVLVGDAAARRGETDPGRLTREFKRRIGDPVPILAGGAPFSAHALTARMLEHVLRAAVAGQGSPPSAVVLTCPANWGPYKRDLLMQAARLADLPPVTLRTEPEAAVIEYAAGSRVAEGDVIAVYDLGGGTFDAAVLRRTAGSFEVLGQPEGIEQLGGMDFDEAVFEHVVSKLPADTLSAADDPATMAALARLRRDCVEAKEALSDDTEVLIPVALPQMHTRIRLTRSEFEAMIRPALTETVGATRRALRSAGVSADEVTSFLLSGGSSRIPLVSQLLSTEFRRPVVLDPHPEHSIALGAARVSLLAQGNSPLPQGKASAASRQGSASAAPTQGIASAASPQAGASAGPSRASDGPSKASAGPSKASAGPSRASAGPSQGRASVGPSHGDQRQEAGGEPAPGAAVHVPEGGAAPIKAVAKASPDRAAEFESPVLLTRQGLDRSAAGAVAPPRATIKAAPARRRLLQIIAAAISVLVIAGAAVYIIRRLTADGGVQAAPPSGQASSAPAAPACGFTDDFTGAELDAQWERTRPDSDATVADGALTLAAPEGSDIYEDKIGAPMVLRSQTGDFQLETELTATPHQFYQGAGLVLWSSQQTYVRLELGWGDVRAIAFEYRNGGKHIKLHPPFKAGPNAVRTNADQVILQLRRVGDTVDARWRRPDETAYTDLGTIDVNLPDTVKVGLSVLNRAQSQNEPEDFSATFEKASLSC